MSPPAITDALGVPLRLRDKVAYVTRYGSTISITKRTVTGLNPHPENSRRDTIFLDDSNRHVKPYNVVKLGYY